MGGGGEPAGEAGGLGEGLRREAEQGWGGREEGRGVSEVVPMGYYIHSLALCGL